MRPMYAPMTVADLRLAPARRVLSRACIVATPALVAGTGAGLRQPAAHP